MIIGGFDSVEAFNLLLNRLDQLIAVLERIADAQEAQLKRNS
jgi:hypothetical protein